MRKALALVTTAAALAALAAAATPAGAADGTTVAAFTVVGGTLSITTTPLTAGAPTGTGTAPSSAISGGAAKVTVPLGATTVLDTRLTSSGWTMSATAPVSYVLSTDNTKTVAGTNSAFYVPDLPLAETTSGLGLGLSTFTTHQSTAAAVDGTSRSRTLLVSNSSGPNAAVFTPVLEVSIPTNTVSGLYTGTVTQSVS